MLAWLDGMWLQQQALLAGLPTDSAHVWIASVGCSWRLSE